eukprot:364631-Chlamydomonas_euryale.AAC.18
MPAPPHHHHTHTPAGLPSWPHPHLGYEPPYLAPHRCCWFPHRMHSHVSWTRPDADLSYRAAAAATDALHCARRPAPHHAVHDRRVRGTRARRGDLGGRDRIDIGSDGDNSGTGSRGVAVAVEAAKRPNSSGVSAIASDCRLPDVTRALWEARPAAVGGAGTAAAADGVRVRIHG